MSTSHDAGAPTTPSAGGRPRRQMRPTKPLLVTSGEDPRSEVLRDHPPASRSSGHEVSPLARAHPPAQGIYRASDGELPVSPSSR